MENQLEIDLAKRPPWQTFDELQKKLHQLSMHPERIQRNHIDEILTEIENCITDHVLPASMHKIIGTSTVQIIHLLGK